MTFNRVVITGMGFISPLGSTESEVINGFNSNIDNFKISPEDEELYISPVNNFDIKEFIGRNKNIRYLNRGAAFSAAAAFNAFKDSGLHSEQIADSGLFIGAGPQLDITDSFKDIKDSNVDWESQKALWILKYLPNTAASFISNLLGIHGENHTISSACASSLHAVGQAFRNVKGGFINVAFAGGGDSRLSIGGLQAYKKANALYKNSKQDSFDYAPFSKNRDGFIPGEGGAFFVLENLECALKRNANIYGEITGFSSTMDGKTMTAPDPSGKWAEKAQVNALKEACLDFSDIKLVSAHGTGTQLNDEMEYNLLKRNFDKQAYVIALKSWIGHLAAACGAVETALSIICMKNNYIPRIKNLNSPMGNEINLQLKSTNSSFENIFIENFGFGGQNSCLVLNKWNP